MKKIGESIPSRIAKTTSELRSSKEDIHLYLSATSSHKHIEIKKFIDDTLQQRQSDNVEVYVIYESQAENFARIVGRSIDNHRR